MSSAELEPALLNLVINAKDAMPQGGRVVITASNDTSVATTGGANVSLVVRDDGTGLEADVLERAFEPFFTTKPVGEGTGLGLSQVCGFCTSAGGSASIESVPGRGTTVRMQLPARTGPAATDTPPGEAPEMSLRGIRVLLVEDNDGVATATGRMLESVGATVTRAQGGAA